MIEENFEKKFTALVPLPMCVVNQNGKILNSNSLIDKVFIYDELTDYDFFALTGIKIADLISAAENNVSKTINRNDRKFRLSVSKDEKTEEGNVFVFFHDITDYEKLKNKYDDERVCVARVNVDNYDEMKINTEPEMQMTISSQVDKIVRRWAAKIRGSIVATSPSEYIIYFPFMSVENITRNKFTVLDEVRDIESEADFPMSLSIGVGIDGADVIETKSLADAAIDLALGRGGDQAVVRRGNKIEYYGGILQTVEKGNKGKSRVIAHALSRLIEQAERIMIMGHKNPDMDAFGSELGMFRFCQINGKNSYIVLSELSDSMQTIYKSAKERDIYMFIDHKKALELIDENTLLIVVDTHRPSYTECGELLEHTERIVVIDHHRKAVDAIESPVLSYIESYASSTAELVTELLQYTGGKKQLDKFEAEALLAGMTVDTNRFAVKTGVRTFEAAAWLRRAGADTTIVKRLFQNNLEDFKARAKAIADAEISEDGIATSTLEGYKSEAQIINSQVADELLNVKGVRAAFVAGRDETGQTVISARSLGEVNVQVIMEKIGGGGHLTTAGAQVEETPEEIIDVIKLILEGMKSEE